MKKIMVAASMMLVGACASSPKGKDILLNCGEAQVVVSPGQVEVLPSGHIKVTNLDKNAVDIIPPQIPCVVSEAELGTLNRQLNNQIPGQKTDI